MEEEYDNADFIVNLDGIKTGKINAGVGMHDQSIFKIKDKYYIYGSHITAAKSKDLKTWTSITDGYDTANHVWAEKVSTGPQIIQPVYCWNEVRIPA